MADDYDDYVTQYNWSISPDRELYRQIELVGQAAEAQGNVFVGDEHALELIDRAFFDMDISHTERDNSRAETAFYFWDEYGIDIFDVWDYDDYRAWYDAA